MALDDILKDIDERKVVNPPVRRNVYVADLNVNVNTDLETPDEINYATRTQVLNKPKQEYIGLKETENPFKLAYNASVDSLKNVLDKVTNFALPEEVRSPIKEASKGAVVAGASLGNLTWGATKIFATEMAMNREMFAEKNALEQSYMKREITQEEYFQKLKELTAKKTEEQNQMREFIGKDIQADNEAFNQWLQDCGFTPDSKVGKFFFDLGGSITSIGMSVIAFAVTKNPMLAISLISVPEFTSTYTEAIDKGLDPEKAMSAGLTNYSFVAGSEFLGGKVLWSTLSKSGFINKAVRKITNLNPRIAISGASGLEEGLQESSQTVGSELINKYYDISQLESREIINNALYDGLQAFLGASLFGGVASNLQFSKIFETEKKELLKLKDAKGKPLYTPEQAEQIATNTANFVQSQELQNEIMNISRNERDNSLSREARNPKEMKRIIEENLKKMETALPEIKKQMLDIKDKVKENFAGLGLDREQLDMVAELTQARAMMYYNAFGITPLQFYYLNELEITVDENSNILSNGRETGYTVRFNEKKVAEALDSGKIQNIIQSIRTKENLNNFGNYVNKLVAEGKMTEAQRSLVYSQLADRMADIPTTEQVVDRVREEEVDKFNQAVYHGTPHRFEEFSTEKIGTGEGAQAHGWGLYFAQDREVSERYREVLVDDPYIERHTYKGKPIKEYYDITGKEIKDLVWQDIMRGSYGISNLVNKIKEEKQKYKKELEQSKKRLKELQEDKENDWKELINHYKENSSQIEKKLDYINSIDLKEIDSHLVGQVFQAEIPEDDVLLDEQKVFQEQPKKVQEAIEEIMKDDEDGKLYNDLLDTNTYDEEEYVDRSLYLGALDGIFKEGDIGDTGKEIYKGLVVAIQDKYGITEDKAQKEASLILNKYGIKGITYDGQEDGRAYVIFDDKAVKVLEKFYQMGETKTTKGYVPTEKEKIKYHLEEKDLGTYEEDFKIALGHILDLLEERKKIKKEYADIEKKMKKSKKKGEEYWKLADKQRELNDKGWKNYYEIDSTKNAISAIEKERGDDIYKPKPNVYWVDDGFNTAFAIEKSKGFLKSMKDKDTDVRVVGEGTNIEDFNPKKLGNKDVVELALKLGFKADKYGYLNKGGNTFNMTTRERDYFIDLALIGGAEIQKEENKRLADIVIKDDNKPYLQKDFLKEVEGWIRDYYKSWNSIKDQEKGREGQNKIQSLPEQQQVEIYFKFLKDDGYDFADEIPLSQPAMRKVNKILRENNYLNLSHNLFDEGQRREQFVADRFAEMQKNINNQTNVRGEVTPRPIDTPVTEQTKSIIRVFQGGDKSTIIHEMAHIFLRDIEVIENQGGVQDEQFKKIKKTLDNWLGKKEGQKYTKEQQEKFAQGFETYMATGQAPKEELKSVFDYFKKWMSDIYNGVKNMIPITPEVKNMFDEILTLQPTNNAMQTQTEGGNGGGGDIMNTPQTQEGGGGNIVPVTPDAKDLGKIENKKGFIKSATDVILDAIEPVSTRLGAIDTRLDYEMKMFEARLSIRQKKYKDASIDFLQQTDKLKATNNQDYLNYDRALKNSDINTINRINEKYPELKKAYEKVRQMLDSIKADLEIYGVSSSVKNYFPRKIANIDGLISYLEGNKEWSDIERAMKKKDPNYKKWSEEQKAEFVASYLSGYQKGVTNTSTHTKQRKIMTITDEIDRYYENSNNALLEYIEDISNFLEVAKLLRVGKDKAYEMVSISKDGTINLEEVIRNIESVLGTFVKDLVKNKEITREQEKKIADLLRARFNFKNTNNAVSSIKSVGYLATLGNINAVITQFGDLSYSIDNAGIFGTLKAIFGKKKIKMQDIGIDHPAEDFKDGVSFSQKLVDKVLTAIGFTKIDELGKNTYIATTFMKYKKAIEKNEQKVYDDISRRYGEEFAKDLIKDLKSDTLSDNIYLFAHTELARVQPISLSEMPKEYLLHPVGRIFYSLKTFWIKQFNRIITDNKRLIQEGVKENNNEKIKEGATSMARLIILFMVLGSGTDMLKDLIYLRKIDLEDTVFDNFLKILGISRYTMYKGREEGYGRVVLDSIFNVPVMQMIDSFITELGRARNGKIKLKDLRIASNIPIIGNPYYWWVGGGRTKEKKKK